MDAFTKLDGYNWVDFVEEYSKSILPVESEVELRQIIRSDLNRVLVRVTKGDGFYVKKNADDDQFDYCKRVDNIKIRYTRRTENGYIHKVAELSKLLKEPNFVRLCSNIVFKPSGICKENELNLWTGFKGKLTEEKDDVIIDHFKYYLRTIWAGENDAIYEYLLDWLSHIVRTPHIKTGKALFLTGPQGCGKNMLAEFFKEYVFGNKYTYETVGIKKLTSKFNKDLQSKIFCIINELSTVKEEFHCSFDKMKSLITENSISIEPKGYDSYMIDNTCNFLMFSNHSASIKIEEGDRRYICIQMSDKHVRDQIFFDTTNSLLFNERAGDIIYTFLSKRKPHGNISRSIKTELGEELKTISLESSLKFIKEVKEGDFILRSPVKDGKIYGQNLYEDYKDWCAMSNETPTTSTKFGMSIKKVMKKERDKHGAYYMMN